MPLVTRWGSEVRTVSPLEPGPEDPKPKALESSPLPFTQLGQAYNRIPFFQNPAPLKRNFQHPLPPELPDPPLAGLDIVGTQVFQAPANGLDLTNASVQAPTNGIDLNDANVIPPANGLDINTVAVTIDKPVAGLDVTNASVQAPAAGLDAEEANVLPPANGLDIDDTLVIPDAPAAGLDVTDASVVPPVAGLDVDSAVLTPPTAGLDIDSAGPPPTLNIEIVSSSEFADDPSTGSEGEIKYSSGGAFIYIHNGTEWHRTDGV
jgi:hypothetical protein